MTNNEIIVRASSTGCSRRGTAGSHPRAELQEATDDLRESPNLELAERFVGKGLDVRIYDPIVNPDKLIGANLRSSAEQACPM